LRWPYLMLSSFDLTPLSVTPHKFFLLYDTLNNVTVKELEVI